MPKHNLTKVSALLWLCWLLSCGATKALRSDRPNAGEHNNNSPFNSINVVSYWQNYRLGPLFFTSYLFEIRVQHFCIAQHFFS